MKKFIEKMKDPRQRGLFYAIFGGKLIGAALATALVLGVSAYFATPKAHAQTTPAPATAPAATPAAPAAAAPAAASGIPETLGPADAAKALGVSEADVIASLEAGDLKGKKIGSQWRITRAAINQFLQ